MLMGVSAGENPDKQSMYEEQSDEKLSCTRTIFQRSVLPQLVLSTGSSITTHSTWKFIIELNIPVKCFFLCISNFHAAPFPLRLSMKEDRETRKKAKIFHP